MVVAVHVHSFHAMDGVPQDGWLHFTKYGWLGVEVFFVLSGLVLYLPYARDES
jgi:peptidoglycan/LPS O-acetylase OafA/YrhL